MEQKVRLDKLLVKYGHADNVNKARALVMAGKVLVNEIKVDKFLYYKINSYVSLMTIKKI